MLFCLKCEPLPSGLYGERDRWRDRLLFELKLASAARALATYPNLAFTFSQYRSTMSLSPVDFFLSGELFEADYIRPCGFGLGLGWPRILAGEIISLALYY